MSGDTELDPAGVVSVASRLDTGASELDAAGEGAAAAPDAGASTVLVTELMGR